MIGKIIKWALILLVIAIVLVVAFLIYFYGAVLFGIIAGINKA